jgi:hypothetical protein
MAMTREEAHQALGEVAEEMADQHGTQPDRLHQLASALSTAKMAVGHLFDHAENMAAAAEGKG